MDGYRRRVIDDELDDLLVALPALCLNGPKGVGKTATASQRASTTVRLDEPATRELFLADPERVVRATPPVLLDEWQREPHHGADALRCGAHHVAVEVKRKWSGAGRVRNGALPRGRPPLRRQVLRYLPKGRRRMIERVGGGCR
ncbi:hypothetical protein [Quadrisphaera granulorum]|uniref:hypothetical protein n=1 Tax=Quadrisphaera granulorum TaxID=317664 RepID=UPI0011B68F23|nr:hypothetical protein [Quadrisphaera granulorum]